MSTYQSLPPHCIGSVCGRSVWILTMMSCASAAKLRAAGPILTVGICAMSRAGSRHLGSSIGSPALNASASAEEVKDALPRGLSQPDARSRPPPPERDQQLACQRDNHRLARASTAIGSAGLVPPGQCALLLKPQKAPGELDHAGPGRCRLWRALVLAASRRSRPASPSGQRSAPLLCGHALAATAPH